MKLIVAGFIFNKNKLLLIFHKRLKRWLPVAGHVEEGEIPEKALLREIKEEVNLDVKFSKKPFDIREDVLNYICKVEDITDLKLKKDELVDFKWFLKDEIKSSNIDEELKKLSLLSFKIFNRDTTL